MFSENPKFRLDDEVPVLEHTGQYHHVLKVHMGKTYSEREGGRERDRKRERIRL